MCGAKRPEKRYRGAVQVSALNCFYYHLGGVCASHQDNISGIVSATVLQTKSDAVIYG